MGVDIAGLDGKFTSADDIARPRGKVFDDDHPPAYTGGGVCLTQLQCGSSALVASPEAEYVPYADSPPRRVRGSAFVRRCSLARSHGALRADRPRSAPVAKVPSVRSGVPFTVEDARKPLEPTVTVGRENVKPMCHASLPPQGDPFDRIRTSFPRKRDPLWRRREFLKREDLSGTGTKVTPGGRQHSLIRTDRIRPPNLAYEHCPCDVEP